MSRYDDYEYGMLYYIKDEYQRMYDAIKDWDKHVDLPEDINAHFANLAWYLAMPIPGLDDSWMYEDVAAVKQAYASLKNELQRVLGIRRD